MALSQIEIDALTEGVKTLNAAIASGTRSVTLGGQTITYGTVDALIKARNDQLAQLKAGNAAVARSRQTYAHLADRGYD